MTRYYVESEAGRWSGPHATRGEAQRELYGLPADASETELQDALCSLRHRPELEGLGAGIVEETEDERRYARAYAAAWAAVGGRSLDRRTDRKRTKQARRAASIAVQGKRPRQLRCPVRAVEAAEQALR